MKSLSLYPDVGSFEWGRAILRRTGRLPLQAIAYLLQHNPDKPLADDLRKASIECLRGQRRRGRKRAMGTARLDFIIADALALYQKKCLEFRAQDRNARRSPPQRRRDPSGEKKAPSERALEYVLGAMKADFPSIGTGALRNLFSSWKRVRDWEPPDD